MNNSCVFIVLVTLSCTKLCWGRNVLNSSTDQTSLLAFKNSIFQPSHGLLAQNWSIDTSVCYWIGVSCDINNQRVTSLNLSSFNLSGTIAPHLGNLTFLTSFDVSFNNFTGLVPNELSSLRRLEQINVGFNSLTGDIPSWFGTLPQLQHIHLNNNTFTGTLPSNICSNTTKLRTLHLYENQLSGKIPPNISKCRDLEDLRLSFNGFDGSIPSEIGSLVNLKIFTVGNNDLSGSIPSSLFNISTLEGINLQSNNFSGSLPSSIDMGLFPLTNLELLYLDNNRFSGVIPSYITNATKLTGLQLHMNSFSGLVPNFGSLRQLQSLVIADNNLSGDLEGFLSSLTNCPYLQVLSISRNSLSGVLTNSVGNLSTSLQRFSANQCNIRGEIPNEIGNLTNLQILGLFSNQLTGTFPSHICDNMPRLRILELSENQFHGEIPPNIYKCRDLAALGLSDNHFNGNIPSEIGSLVNLQILSLSNNSFGGSIPKQLGNLTFLHDLFLNYNKLTGELPEELSNLVYLEKLNVRNNDLSGPIPSFMFNISTMRRMSLSSNNFSGNLPSTIGMGLSFSNLEELYLSDNRLVGPIPSYITNGTKLTLLQMSENSFSGHIPNFGVLRLLQTLRIWDNDLTGDVGFISSFTNCPYLQELDISINPFNGILPTTVGNLSTSLELFIANECNITGPIPSDFGNLSSLRLLSLSTNQLTGFIPTTLGKLQRLERIFLDGNRLQGHIPPEVCKMSKLGGLRMNDNMLTNAIPECFGELTTLRRVNLGSNNLTSNIPSTFWNLVDLLELNLSKNYLSGQLSPQVSNLKVINILDLSWNEFSGQIPSLIGSSQSIEFLLLAHNRFEGSIPQSLGNIINLRSLDLSSNNISGVIPKSLEGLRYLQYFNVSYNKLEGEIPTGGPFVNFTAQSFEQNSALCGATRFHVQLCGQTHKGSRVKKIFLLFVKFILPPIITAIILIIIAFELIRRTRKKNKIPQVVHDVSIGTAWRRISYQELVLGTSAFSETNLLGRGGFGSVFKGTLSDGLNVAVKVFNMQSEGASKSFDTESEILSSVRHRNLVRIIGCCCVPDFKAIVLTYMPNGSLENWLYSESYSLDMLHRVNIALDVALALEYLHHGHTFPIVHCDLKPSNVLLDEDMTAHVADFGLSKLFDDGEVAIQTNTLATVGYTAPEYGSEGKVSTNGDIYSYGILLLEMFTGKRPTDDMFSGEMSLKDWASEALLHENGGNKIVAPGLVINEQCISSVFRLAIECLAFSPEDRPNSRQIVAYLQNIKDKIPDSNKMV